MKRDTITTPEGVPVDFDIAGLGVRLGAQIIDVLLTMLLIGAFALSVTILGLGGQWLMGFSSLAFFFFRIPYYVLTEMMWNGATLGKRMLGIRVVSAEGGTLGVYPVVARNLMKEAEVFLPLTLVLTLSTDTPVGSGISALWCLMALLIPLLNKRRQRLGDIIAGTMVIHRPEAVLLQDAATTPSTRQGAAFAFQTNQLEHYGAYELQTLEAVLQRAEQTPRANRARQDKEIASIVEAIRTKIGYAEAVRAEDHADFLAAFYAAQRRHLEGRQLFGDRRKDKYHRESATEESR